MTLHLKETGITDDQILEMNFESYAYKNMTSDSFYEYVKQHIVPNKKNVLLFFDEVQRVPDWEDAVNSFRVDFNCDIYVTGSNAYMLSSEYATYLSGKCIEIKMLPLSFFEFLTFHDFEIRETKSALGRVHENRLMIKWENIMNSVKFSMHTCDLAECRVSLT
ncbi:MAG: ATP-binding protein [Roseburia sp.]